MMMLHAKRCHHGVRVDSEGRSLVEAMYPVIPSMIADNPGDFWEAQVVNFDEVRAAHCVLELSYPSEAILEVADLLIPICAPPVDDRIISKLIGFLGGQDDQLRMRARVGLLLVGKDALPALRGRLSRAAMESQRFAADLERLVYEIRR
jgi:hypothetical protein